MSVVDIETAKLLRRALRREATYLTKFRREIIDGGLEDHWRWKKWVRGIPPAVHQLLAAAEVLDDVIGIGGNTVIIGNVVSNRHAAKRKRRSSAAIRNAASAQFLRVVH
jgi:hypothetical protein